MERKKREMKSMWIALNYYYDRRDVDSIFSITVAPLNSVCFRCVFFLAIFSFSLFFTT